MGEAGGERVTSRQAKSKASASIQSSLTGVTASSFLFLPRPRPLGVALVEGVAAAEPFGVAAAEPFGVAAAEPFGVAAAEPFGVAPFGEERVGGGRPAT